MSGVLTRQLIALSKFEKLMSQQLQTVFWSEVKTPQLVKKKSRIII